MELVSIHATFNISFIGRLVNILMGSRVGLGLLHLENLGNSCQTATSLSILLLLVLDEVLECFIEITVVISLLFDCSLELLSLDPNCSFDSVDLLVQVSGLLS